MSLTLRCVVIDPLGTNQEFTFPADENPALWEAAKKHAVGTRLTLKDVNIQVLPLEGGPVGYDVSRTHEELTNVLSGLSQIKVIRHQMVLVLQAETLPQDHPAVNSFLKTTDVTHETEAIASAASDTGKITKEGQADAQKRYEEAKKNSKGPAAIDSRAAADAQLKRLFNKR